MPVIGIRLNADSTGESLDVISNGDAYRIFTRGGRLIACSPSGDGKWKIEFFCDQTTDASAYEALWRQRTRYRSTDES